MDRTPPRLQALCIDANDPTRLAEFWSAVLGRELVGAPHDGPTLLPDEAPGFDIRFTPTSLPKTGRNRMHLDLTSSSAADQRRTVRRALARGASHLDVGQRPEEGHVVLADPEGNEFCVIGPDNAFLAGCGFLGALACDGTRRVGEFWSAALRWPLVWDEGEETAIQSPRGGPKISWGGPPLPPKIGRGRLRFELAVAPGADLAAAAAELVALGAAPDPAGSPGAAVALADPDGNEFTLRGGTG